jgi:hypothetical protein
MRESTTLDERSSMTVLRGLLRAFDSGTYQATVQVDGSRHAAITVPVSKAIPAAEMAAGRKVGILQFWPNDPSAAVVVAVWQ